MSIENNKKIEIKDKLKTPNRILAMTLMILIAVLVSLGPLLLRSMEDADVWQILFYRSVSWIAALCMILLFKYRFNLLKNIHAIGKWGVIAGLLLAFAQITYIQALNNITVANTTFVLSAIPFLTALVAFIFLREKIKLITLLMMVVAGSGIYIMVSGGIRGGNAYGNFMALLTLAGFASFPVILRKNRHIDMLPTMLVPALIIGLVGLCVKGNDLNISNNDLILSFIWGGVINGFAHTLFIAVSRKLLAAEITLFMLLEFILSPLWVWGLIGEVPAKDTLTGGIFVIFAIIMIAAIELFNFNKKQQSDISEKTVNDRRILSNEEIKVAVKNINENNKPSNEFILTKNEIERLIRKDMKSWIENYMSKTFKKSLEEYFSQTNKR
mgnify:CR=1 FL=1